MNEEKQRELLKEVQENLKKSIDLDFENKAMALDDLMFIAVEQWPDDIRKEREAASRPCITINKMPTYIDQVVGDQRMNRPSIKVIPVDSESDPEVARILGGWIKHVQQISKSDVAIDHGFEHAVACGYGALRVVTDYVTDASFEQEAYIKPVDNALAVYWGKHSEYDCSDALYCILVEDIDRDEFKRRYKTEPMDFKGSSSNYVEGWCSKDSVRIAEYFVKEPIKKTLYELADGRVVDSIFPDDEVKRKRVVDSYKIMWYLVSGDKVLDSREWPGKKYIPVVPIFGKEYNVGGKKYLRGLIRYAKDAQRMYNYWQSVDTEIVALQPKSPYMLTAKQIAGYEEMWDQAQHKNFPYLLVNTDEKAPGFPQRQSPPQASSAMVQKISASDQEIRDTIGIQKAGMGMTSNERSGAAIRERKKEGDVGTFAFIDNLARSIEHLGRVLVDIAPVILDTERVVRLGLDDGSQEFAKINVEGENGKIFNDLSLGTYDVVVTVGPSFTTQRTEAQASMKEFIQYYPAAAPLIGDLYARSMDWPGAEDFAKRLELALPPDIKALIDEEKKNKNPMSVDGQNTPPQPAQPVPPPGAGAPSPAVPAPPPPDPLMEMKMAEEQLKIQEMQIKLEQEKAKLVGIQLQNQAEQNKSRDSLKQLVMEVLQERANPPQPVNNFNG